MEFVHDRVCEVIFAADFLAGEGRAGQLDGAEVRDEDVVVLEAPVQLIHGDEPEVVLLVASEEDGVVREDFVDFVGIFSSRFSRV